MKVIVEYLRELLRKGKIGEKYWEETDKIFHRYMEKWGDDAEIAINGKELDILPKVVESLLKGVGGYDVESLIKDLNKR